MGKNENNLEIRAIPVSTALGGAGITLEFNHQRNKPWSILTYRLISRFDRPDRLQCIYMLEFNACSIFI